LQEIKAAAKQGNTAGTRILAQQLVRLRAQITKMHTAQAQLRGVSTSVTVSWQASGASWRLPAAATVASCGGRCECTALGVPCGWRVLMLVLLLALLPA
jgi:hypothetical protein